MTKKLVKQLFMAAFVFMLCCVPTMTVNATQMEEVTEESEDADRTPLTFDIAIFTYEMLEDATQEDMPNGFTLGDWEYNGVAVKAGFTENSDMICVMGEDWETGYTYRFIYDPNHDMFVPYFGADIKNGYIYTVPMYDEAEIPYGFVDAYFVIQTVPMFTYMREDAELTQEEIAVGSLSEDNYLVFLMMDENGKEVHYTYDLIDRTFQRSLLQKKDAEKITELNEVIDELHTDIGELNAINAERMNKRLTLIGILIALVVIMAGIIVNLLMKLFRAGKEEDEEDEDEQQAETDTESAKSNLFDMDFVTEDDYVEDEDEDDDEAYEVHSQSGLRHFFAKKRRFYDDEEDVEEEEVYEEPKKNLETLHLDFPDSYEEEIEILDLDLDD